MSEWISPENKPADTDDFGLRPQHGDEVSVMIIDELTELKDGKLQRVCRRGGKSFAKAGAIIDMLFQDADRIVEGVRKAAPRLLADQIGRENERLRKFIGK